MRQKNIGLWCFCLNRFRHFNLVKRHLYFALIEPFWASFVINVQFSNSIRYLLYLIVHYISLYFEVSIKLFKMISMLYNLIEFEQVFTDSICLKLNLDTQKLHSNFWLRLILSNDLMNLRSVSVTVFLTL